MTVTPPVPTENLAAQHIQKIAAETSKPNPNLQPVIAQTVPAVAVPAAAATTVATPAVTPVVPAPPVI